MCTNTIFVPLKEIELFLSTKIVGACVIQVKLEKLRFEGREKIMGRLGSAQRRAQEMRGAAEAHKVEQLTRVGMRANHIRKSGHLPSSTYNVVCSLTTKIKPTSSLSFA